MYEDYVTARVNGHVNLLAKEIKVGNKMFDSGSKTTVIKFRDKMVALNETTDLYGTLMILTHRPETLFKLTSLAIMNLLLHRYNLFSLMGQCYEAQTRLS